ncbi:MAG: FAD-dependent oxidoreductase, partial [Sphingomonadales bacterium]
MTRTELCIVGGGPAGMMAGLLFARAGVETLVLEKHADFLRDFRGDTVHPSTLNLFDELGLMDALLERPHDKVKDIEAVVGGHAYRIADFTHLPGRARFVALMPQWEFLDFVAQEAKRYPAFTLRMESEGVAAIGRGGRVTGVRTAAGEEIAARLVIAADGRGSALRAGLPLHDLGAPIDVLW